MSVKQYTIGAQTATLTNGQVRKMARWELTTDPLKNQEGQTNGATVGENSENKAADVGAGASAQPGAETTTTSGTSGTSGASTDGSSGGSGDNGGNGSGDGGSANTKSGFGAKLNAFNTSAAGKATATAMGYAGLGTDLITSGLSAAGVGNFGKNNDTGFKEQQAIGDMLIKTGNPYAAIAGVAYKGLSAIAEGTGTNSSKLSADQAERAGFSKTEKFFNNLATWVPFTGAGKGNLAMDAYDNQEIDKVASAYTGTATDIDTASSMGGKRYAIGNRKANNFISQQNDRVNMLTAISRDNTLRRNSTYGLDLMSQNQNRFSGNTYQNMEIGKSGLKLMTKAEAKALLSKYKKGGKNYDKSDLYSLLAQFDYILTGKVENQIIKDVNQLRTDVKRDGFDEKDVLDLTMNLSMNQDFIGAVQELQKDLFDKEPILQKTFKDSPEELISIGRLTNPSLSQYPLDFIRKNILPAREALAQVLGQPSLVGSFQNGGVIGIDTNILPEGALHRELNDLDDINPEIGEEVTKKGIPVIVTDKDGNIDQVAEIEKEEIILRKELTTKIEALWKDGSEEAMIEAGKLLAEEIITNTQDNTGQLED